MATLSSYFTILPTQTLDTSYASRNIGEIYTVDLNSDGNNDLFITGLSFPPQDNTAQPGRVAFGDGKGGFILASQSIFPWQTLNTVHPREIAFADFNGDGRIDVFVASHGWDASPFPGEQNRLYLSNSDGSWRDATLNLPQLLDFSHSVATGDIDKDGDLDLYVGNIYGQAQIAPYLLINDGLGNFSKNSTRIPSDSGQLLSLNVMKATSETFVDLDNDGYPELILGNLGESTSKPYSLILWNQTGQYTESNSTQLAANGTFGTTTVTLDVQTIDMNGDGLKDLLMLGTQSNYNGWEVQILINKGNHTFADETTLRLAAADSASNTPGQAWGKFLQPLDFNMDGAPDFAVTQWSGTLAPSTPVVWLNDGSGHFTTLKVSDFVDNQQAYLIDAYTQLFKTDQGWSFARSFKDQTNSQLTVDVILATTPYKATASVLAEGFASVTRTGGSVSDSLAGGGGNDKLAGGGGNDTLIGGTGIDSALYQINRSLSTITKTTTGFTVSSAVDGSDTLVSIERLKFADTSVALDITGNAGTTAKILGAVFGKESIAIKGYVGIGLDKLDNGMSYQDLMLLALNAKLGSGFSIASEVTLLYQNLAGVAPSADNLSFWTNAINTGQYTQASLGVMAADYSLNTNNINLVGLAQTGIEYV